MVEQNLLQIADAVAREKGIERDQVLIAMEEAIEKLGKTKYGLENDIRANIDRKNGSIKILRYREIVDAVENPNLQISIQEAKTLQEKADIGSFVIDPLPPIDFGRVSAQSARQIISQKVREAERERQYQVYKDKVGEITTGIVKRNEFGNYFVDLGKAEAILRRDEVIPRENLQNGDRIKVYIQSVEHLPKGPQIELSRANPQFMAKLFEQEVPEVYEHVIEIVSVARDPGSRAKIAVRTNDTSIDPVGACVGIRGSRIQAIINELQGEKIDIITWAEDPATYVINALTPAEISKVVVDEETNKIEVIVPDDQLSIAIGRKGQNVRLASLLTGLDVSILSDSKDSEKREETLKKTIAHFMETLDVDQIIAHLLATEGYRSTEEIVDSPEEELLEIEGFDESIIKELKNRAAIYIEKQNKKIEEDLKTFSIQEDLKNFKEISLKQLYLLAKNDILTLDDLADLDTDELLTIFNDLPVDKIEAEETIMAARAHWFKE